MVRMRFHGWAAESPSYQMISTSTFRYPQGAKVYKLRKTKLLLHVHSQATYTCMLSRDRYRHFNQAICSTLHPGFQDLLTQCSSLQSIPEAQRPQTPNLIVAAIIRQKHPERTPAKLKLWEVLAKQGPHGPPYIVLPQLPVGFASL